MQGNNVMIGVGGWGVVSFGYSKLVCLHYIRLSFDIIMEVTYESIYFKEEEACLRTLFLFLVLKGLA